MRPNGLVERRPEYQAMIDRAEREDGPTSEFEAARLRILMDSPCRVCGVPMGLHPPDMTSADHKCPVVLDLTGRPSGRGMGDERRAFYAQCLLALDAELVEAECLTRPEPVVDPNIYAHAADALALDLRVIVGGRVLKLKPDTYVYVTPGREPGLFTWNDGTQTD